VNSYKSDLVSCFNKSQDYHEFFLRLIKSELEDELSMTEERLRNWSNKKLEMNGIALFGLVAKPDGWLFGQRIIRLKPTSGEYLGFHRFRQGDIVLLSRVSPITEKPIEAIISERSRNSIKIVLGEQPKGIRKGKWRMDRGANRIAFDRMRDAINSTFEEGGSVPLRELIMGKVHSPANTSTLTPELGGIKKRKITLPGDLNQAQREAAKGALERRLSLIQGPPGTGKTHTAIRILESWAKEDFGTILAVADSNVAVDNLLEGLINRGVRAVRLGQPVKVREELRDATLDAKMQTHPLRKDLDYEIGMIEKLRRRIKGMRGKEKGLAHRDLKNSWKIVKKYETQMRDDILDRAQILCCTCIGSGHEILDGRRFTRVLIDEATQATEPASLVPISRGARQIVLIGDHKQLPPTVISRKAEKGGLARSLFERMVEMGVVPMLLKTQYRMHPIISEFPNLYFYSGQLEDGVKTNERATPNGISWPDWENPIAFIPLEGNEETSPDGASKENHEEASKIVSLLIDLIDGGNLEAKDIGIITPYAGQVRAIRDSMPESLQSVEVRTVDGYQGREKEVILFSCVRSNNEGNIGFLSDGRRLNVALTRAKRGLIVVGNHNTLRNDVNWNEWLEYISKKNLQAWHLKGGI